MSRSNISKHPSSLLAPLERRTSEGEVKQTMTRMPAKTQGKARTRRKTTSWAGVELRTKLRLPTASINARIHKHVRAWMRVHACPVLEAPSKNNPLPEAIARPVSGFHIQRQPSSDTINKRTYLKPRTDFTDIPKHLVCDAAAPATQQNTTIP